MSIQNRECNNEYELMAVVLDTFYTCYRNLKSTPFLVSELLGEACGINCGVEYGQMCCAIDANLFKIIVRPAVAQEAAVNEFVDKNACLYSKLKWERKYRVGHEKYRGEYSRCRPDRAVELCKLLAVAVFTQRYKEQNEALDELQKFFCYETMSECFNSFGDCEDIDDNLKKMRTHMNGEYGGTDESWLILLDESLILYGKIFDDAIGTLEFIRRTHNGKVHRNKSGFVL